MKKTAIALAMATVLGVAGTAMAANPFTDVPANHWSYASVSKLAQAGIIEGYGDGTFRGNNSITRYEMAQMVAKAMARSDKADAAQKAMIEKLAAEYSAELNNLGVRVTSLEKKVGTVKVTGDARIRYRENIDLNGFDDVDGDQRNRWDMRVRLGLASDLNDKVSFTGRIAAQSTSYDQNTAAKQDVSSNDTLKWDLASFTFKDVLGGKLEAGRFVQFVGATGLVTDVSNPGVDGLRYTYENNDVRVAVSHVDVSTNKAIATNQKYVATADSLGALTGTASVLSSGNTSLPMTYVDAAWKTGKLTLNGTYFKSDDEKAFAYTGWIAGASYKFDKNWKISGDYAKNTSDEWDGSDLKDSGYLVRVNYKGADYAKKGSWGMWADYRKAPSLIADQNLTTLNAQNSIAGNKGYEIGVNYALYKNILLQVMMDKLETYNGIADGYDYDTFYRATMDFKF